ncbi:urate oxidase [Neobacillus ginsengisoli]|uniref:Uricase n=1 Tax=Neobacillus ginsengisoli TaxID=904295 RepID=A0ABT9Y053_9BACI|nr:urate oxidase [Neobacillus ginsengisoli]
MMERAMYYGKGDVFAYKTYVKPLLGVRKIPESNFSGRNNIVFGLNAKVSVGGKDFLPSFTKGDNSLIVATDSMKNFIQRHLASYQGSTIEGFLSYTAKAFLEKYPQMETVKIIGEDLPFETVSASSSAGLTESDLVFKRSLNEASKSMIEMVRTEGGTMIANHSSSIIKLQLIKVRGNSFVGFVRDEYTTLPEDSNRPLFVYLNISWKYENVIDSYGENPSLYVASEQVRDIAAFVFHETETPSIQNLIYLIGCRILERFPQLIEVMFESQNHTWDTVVDHSPDTLSKVYTEPRPPYGFQVFSVLREDLDKDKADENSLKSTPQGS